MKGIGKAYLALTVLEAAFLGWVVYKSSTAKVRPWATSRRA